MLKKSMHFNTRQGKIKYIQPSITSGPIALESEISGSVEDLNYKFENT